MGLRFTPIISLGVGGRTIDEGEYSQVHLDGHLEKPLRRNDLVAALQECTITHNQFEKAAKL